MFNVQPGKPHKSLTFPTLHGKLLIRYDTIFVRVHPLENFEQIHRRLVLTGLSHDVANLVHLDHTVAVNIVQMEHPVDLFVQRSTRGDGETVHESVEVDVVVVAESEDPGDVL